MNTNKISRLRKVKLFLIYEVIYNVSKYNSGIKVTHSNANNSIRSKECDF